MKKLTFEVSEQKDFSVVSLLEEIGKISCRMYLDFENSLIVVENVSNTMIDTVVEVIKNYYTIRKVNIDNTFEEDSFIQNVKFPNEYIEGLINKFLKTLGWAMFKRNILEKEIGNFIYTSMNEISMNYNRKGWIEFSVGDVVDCYYGIHLNGETRGEHISAIVCDIDDNDNANRMAYLVPITKYKTNVISQSYLIFNTPEDVEYKIDGYTGGIALLDRGKYVSAVRIKSVIGNTTRAFLEKLLNRLPVAFDFTHHLK